MTNLIKYLLFICQINHFKNKVKPAAARGLSVPGKRLTSSEPRIAILLRS